MRILLVSRFLPYTGGSETTAYELANALSVENKIALATVDLGRIEKNFDVFDFGNNSLPLDLNQTDDKIEKIIRSFNPDIISCHTPYLLEKVLHAKNLLKIDTPVTLTLHTDFVNFGLERYKNLFLESVLPKVNFLITVCDHGFKMVSTKTKFPYQKIAIIKCGIDTNVFCPAKLDKKVLRHKLRLPIDKFIFVLPVRMDPLKGIEYLIESVSGIKESLNNVLFLISSPPGRNREDEIVYANHIKSIIYKRNLSDFFEFGFFEFASMSFVYNASDAFILPSKTEQLPVSILEAQASGLPVIATNVGGVSEIVSNQNTGLLIDFGAKSSLARAIKNIVDDSVLRKKISINARKNVLSNYTKENMAKNYIQLFRNLSGQI